MVDSESPNGSSPQTAAKYGITKPISLAGPTEADLQRNMELEKVKIRSDFFSFCWLGYILIIVNFLI
jgi:poly(A) polymerase